MLGKKRRPPVNKNSRINAFMSLNGWPYVLAEYLDGVNFRQIDRSRILNNISVMNPEPHRTVVDVDIDDVGIPVGNRTMWTVFLESVARRAQQMGHFDVIRSGIVVQVDYRIEDPRSGTLIRSMSDNLVIRDRNYFMAVNNRDIDNNAVVANFSDSMIINSHNIMPGGGGVMFRLQRVRLFYQAVRRNNDTLNDPRQQDRFNPIRVPNVSKDHNLWNHHRTNQSSMVMRDDGSIRRMSTPDHFVNPPQWAAFNEFYHFNDFGRSLILHHDIINDVNTTVYLIPCGDIRVDRLIPISAVQRIHLKFNIWKNDLVVVNNTRKIVDMLGIRFFNTFRPHPGNIDRVLRDLLRAINDEALNLDLTEEQVRDLTRLVNSIIRPGRRPRPRPAPPPRRPSKLNQLIDLLNQLVNGGDNDIGDPTGTPDDNPSCPPDCPDCPPCCDEYPNCDCDNDIFDPDDPCCADYPNCDCHDAGLPCCGEYPNCDCDYDPIDPDPCCPEYPNCDCHDPGGP